MPWFLVVTLLLAQTSAEASGDAFSLPRLDGYKNASYGLIHQGFAPPIYKQLLVLKPVAEATSKQQLITILRSFFVEKGWREKQSLTNDLEFNFELYNDTDQYGYTQVHGTCDVWIADKGDLMVIHQYQSRISRLDIETDKRFESVVASVTKMATELKLDSIETHTSDWPTFFSDENLVRLTTLSITGPRLPDEAPSRFLIRILAYRSDKHATAAFTQLEGVNRFKRIIHNGNVVIAIETQDPAVSDAIDTIANHSISFLKNQR